MIKKSLFLLSLAGSISAANLRAQQKFQLDQIMKFNDIDKLYKNTLKNKFAQAQNEQDKQMIKQALFREQKPLTQDFMQEVQPLFQQKKTQGTILKLLNLVGSSVSKIYAHTTVGSMTLPQKIRHLALSKAWQQLIEQPQRQPQQLNEIIEQLSENQEIPPQLKKTVNELKQSYNNRQTEDDNRDYYRKANEVVEILQNFNMSIYEQFMNGLTKGTKYMVQQPMILINSIAEKAQNKYARLGQSITKITDSLQITKVFQIFGEQLKQGAILAVVRQGIDQMRALSLNLKFLNYLQKIGQNQQLASIIFNRVNRQLNLMIKLHGKIQEVKFIGYKGDSLVHIGGNGVALYINIRKCIQTLEQFGIEQTPSNIQELLIKASHSFQKHKMDTLDFANNALRTQKLGTVLIDGLQDMKYFASSKANNLLFNAPDLQKFSDLIIQGIPDQMRLKATLQESQEKWIQLWPIIGEMTQFVVQGGQFVFKSFMQADAIVTSLYFSAATFISLGALWHLMTLTIAVILYLITLVPKLALTGTAQISLYIIKKIANTATEQTKNLIHKLVYLLSAKTQKTEQKVYMDGKLIILSTGKKTQQIRGSLYNQITSLRFTPIMQHIVKAYHDWNSNPLQRAYRTFQAQSSRVSDQLAQKIRKLQDNNIQLKQPSYNIKPNLVVNGGFIQKIMGRGGQGPYDNQIKCTQMQEAQKQVKKFTQQYEKLAKNTTNFKNLLIKKMQNEEKKLENKMPTLIGQYFPFIYSTHSFPAAFDFAVVSVKEGLTSVQIANKLSSRIWKTQNPQLMAQQALKIIHNSLKMGDQTLVKLAIEQSSNNDSEIKALGGIANYILSIDKTYGQYVISMQQFYKCGIREKIGSKIYFSLVSDPQLKVYLKQGKLQIYREEGNTLTLIPQNQFNEKYLRSLIQKKIKTKNSFIINQFNDSMTTDKKLKAFRQNYLDFQK